MMPQKTVLFCGGGSLGHIAPSVAVADALKAADSAITPVFVCSTRTEEHAFIQKSGYRFLPLSAPRFPRGLSVEIFTFPFVFIASLFKSFRVLAEERPAAVFSKGGAVCVPLCLAAAWKKIPVVLHASDSVLSVGEFL
jgi:UDP-N-acetylglucosamine--N-acetylmuramyl-(pentapeptide) pyrophosphoryl-undecaprenol N-acetylglucosamine transferase